MKNIISKHFYKIIYIFVCAVILVSVFSFEASVSKDRKSHANPVKMKASGIVKSVPRYSYGKTAFIMKASDSTDIREMMYVQIDRSENLHLCIGDTITLTGLCYVPDGSMNPGSFDFASYIRTKGASLAMNSDISSVHGHKRGIFHSVYSLRDKISSKVSEYIPGDEGGLANALITGSKELISDSCSEHYRKSGIYHIVSVSGMHLGILIIFLSVLYGRLTLPKRRKAVVSLAVTLFACVFMFVFTGFGVSVERAAFMALISCCAAIFMREYSPFTSLFIVFAFILISAPYFYRDASFCLSFSANAGILAAMYIVKRINIKHFKWLTESIIVSVCVTLTSLPFVIAFFGAVSVVSPITNLAVVNIIPILMVLCYIFAAICMFCPDFICAAFANVITCISYCVNAISSFFAGLPFAYINITYGILVMLLSYAAAFFAFFRFKKRSMRFVIVSAVIIANIVCLSYNRLNPCTDITFLNAGQGDCSIIKSSDGLSVMIDCGSESVYNFGAAQAVPYLKNQGITKLDYLILSHYHADHADGAITLMESGYVNNLILPDRPLGDDEEALARKIYKSAISNSIPITHVSKGDSILYGRHRFDVVSPEKSEYADTNDGSIVIKYTFMESSVLFCADASSLAQYNMLPYLSACDIVKVAHHGAKASVSHRFAQKADCKYAVISCGKDNKYSHPDKDTLDAYKNAAVLRTDIKNQPISFTINKKGVKLKNARH